MSSKTNCPFCQHHLIAPDKLMGTIVTCPSCKKEFLLGAAPAPSPPDTPIQKLSAGSTVSSKSNNSWLIYLVVAIAAGVFGLVHAYNSTPPDGHIEEMLANHMESTLDSIKQQLFDSIHPTGSAKSIKVHEVTIDAWKGGRHTNRGRDVLQFTVRFTLYWEGPVTKDGFTKLTLTWDMESKRWISSSIIATNGITNENVVRALGKAIDSYIQYEAIKAAAQESFDNQ